MMTMIDLRSDTVSQPTPAMREAMANAELGDDVYGEDPTVNRLEAMAAEITGMEAALFTTSGTQSNLLAILTHCQTRGDELIMGYAAHIMRSTVGGAAVVGGVHSYPVPIQDDGTLALDDLRAVIRDDRNVHYPKSRMIALENTNGARSGMPLTVDYTQSVRDLCDEHDMRLHIDGARIFNAAAALHTTVGDLVGPAHSVAFCISKGLCAPVGSLLCGPADFIRQARKFRKMLGGGMRQAGVLAAAGIVAFEEIAPRMADDHVTAKRLAEGIEAMPGLTLAMAVETNIILFSIDEDVPMSADAFRGALEQDHGIRIGGRGGRHFRAVTHYWISADDIEATLDAMQRVLAGVSV